MLRLITAENAHRRPQESKLDAAAFCKAFCENLSLSNVHGGTVVSTAASEQEGPGVEFLQSRIPLHVLPVQNNYQTR